MRILLYMDPFVDYLEKSPADRSYVLRYELMPSALQRQLQPGDELVVFSLEELLEYNDLKKIFSRDSLNYFSFTKDDIKKFLNEKKVSAESFVKENIDLPVLDEFLERLNEQLNAFQPDIIYGWGMLPTYLERIYPEALILEGEHSAFSRIFGEADVVCLPKRKDHIQKLIREILSQDPQKTQKEWEQINGSISDLISDFDAPDIPEFSAKGKKYFYPGHFPSTYAIKFSDHFDDLEVLHEIVDGLEQDDALFYTKHPLYKNNPNESLDYFLENCSKIQDLSKYSFDKNFTIKAIQSSDIVVNSHSKSVYLAIGLNKPVLEKGLFFSKNFTKNDDLEHKVSSLESKKLLLWHIRSRISHPLFNAGAYYQFFVRQYNFYVGNSPYPYFSNVVEFQNLIHEATLGLTSKKLRRTPSQYEQLKVMGLKPEIKNVCTDVFDTLLWRPVVKPSDIFYLMSGDASDIVESEKFDFYFARVNAEWVAKKRACNKNFEDTNIDEIYSEFSKLYAIDNEKVQKLKNLELLYEKRYLRPRRSMLALMRFFKDHGKRICAISDMYLHPEQVKELIVGCGYDPSIEVYVSSSEKVTKKSGLIFKKVQEKYNIKPYESIFIGDNLNSDVTNPTKFGYTAFHFPSGMDKYVSTVKVEPYLQLQLRHTVSPYISTLANTVFDNPYVEFSKETFANNSYYLLGFMYFGPFLSGFVSWLIESISERENKYKKVLFCSRDCKLIKEIFDIYSNNRIPSEYFYLSRSSTLPLFRDRMNSPLLVDKYNSRYSAKDFLKRYFDSPLLVSKNPLLSRQDKANFAKEIADNYEQLVSKESDELQITNLKGYLKQLVGDSDFALVDSGARGTSRDALSDLLHKDIDLYLLREYKYKKSHKNKIFSWHKESFNYYRHGRQAFISNFYEPIISCCTEESCQGYDFDGNKYVPIVTQSEYTDVACKVLSIQKGILDFCQLSKSLYQDITTDIYLETSVEFLKAPVEALHARQGEVELFSQLSASNALCGEGSFDLLMPVQSSTKVNGAQIQTKVYSDKIYGKGAYRKATSMERRIDLLLKKVEGVPILSYFVGEARNIYIKKFMANGE